jgi:hypothetical protein
LWIDCLGNQSGFHTSRASFLPSYSFLLCQESSLPKTIHPAVSPASTSYKARCLFSRAGTQDWFDANPNRPLTIGGQLWADQGWRGELHLGSTAIRVFELTGVSFLNLSDQSVQTQVAQGSADFRIVRMYDNENYEIDTANQAFTILRPCEYRVDVSPDGSQTVVTVRSGAGEVTAGGQAYEIAGGPQYTFQGIDELDYGDDSLPDPNNFDNWCSERDNREDRARSLGKMISMRTDAGPLWASLTQGHSLRLHGPPATHESGHSYFAQIGHSHFAATLSVNLCQRKVEMSGFVPDRNVRLQCFLQG